MAIQLINGRWNLEPCHEDPPKGLQQESDTIKCASHSIGSTKGGRGKVSLQQGVYGGGSGGLTQEAMGGYGEAKGPCLTLGVGV